MTKLGSRKLNICPKVTKMGFIIGHRIGYNEVGAPRASGTYAAKINPSTPPPPRAWQFYVVLSAAEHDCERRSSSRPNLLASACLYYLARPTKTAMLRWLYTSVCCVPFESQARVDVTFWNPKHRTKLIVNLKQPDKSQLFSVHLWFRSVYNM